MDGGAWRAIVHVVPKSRTRLSDQQFDFHSATAASAAAAGPGVRAVTTWSRVSTEYFLYHGPWSSLVWGVSLKDPGRQTRKPIV